MTMYLLNFQSFRIALQLENGRTFQAANNSIVWIGKVQTDTKGAAGRVYYLIDKTDLGGMPGLLGAVNDE